MIDSGLYLKVDEMYPVIEDFGGVTQVVGISVVANGKKTTLPYCAYQTLDVKEHNKAVRNEVFDAINKVRKLPWLERVALGFDHLWDMPSGEDFMKKYKDWAEAEAAKETKINEAIEFLKENGYLVIDAEKAGLERI